MQVNSCRKTRSICEKGVDLARDRSGQTELCECRQVGVGRTPSKAAKYEMGDAAVRGAQLRCDGADRDACGPVGREGIDASRYRRKGDRREVGPRCKPERGPITGREQVLFSSMPALPDRPHSMDDVAGRQSIAAGHFCRTGFATTKRSALGQQVAAAEQGAVGSVDNGIGVKRRDVGDADVKPRRTDCCGSKRRDIGDRGGHECELITPIRPALRRADRPCS